MLHASRHIKSTFARQSVELKQLDPLEHILFLVKVHLKMSHPEASRVPVLCPDYMK